MHHHLHQLTWLEHHEPGLAFTMRVPSVLACDGRQLRRRALDLRHAVRLYRCHAPYDHAVLTDCETGLACASLVEAMARRHAMRSTAGPARMAAKEWAMCLWYVAQATGAPGRAVPALRREAQRTAAYQLRSIGGRSPALGAPPAQAIRFDRRSMDWITDDEQTARRVSAWLDAREGVA